MLILVIKVARIFEKKHCGGLSSAGFIKNVIFGKIKK